jgi:putative ABC transport system permease protein
MLAYYFSLALRGLKYNIGLTALMLLAIGAGVGASTTTYAVFRAVSGDPIPWKSAQLFIPQIDPWGPTHAIRRRGEPPDALGYLDATRLMQAHRARLQSAIYAITPLVTPTEGFGHPFDVTGHAVYSEFFPMLDVPFRYGSGWSAHDDAEHAAVAVISDRLNRKLFAGKYSVGKTLNLQGKGYRIVGVLDNWNPQPRFYDIMDTETGGFTGQNDDVFIPFTAAIEAPIENDGFTMCAETPSAPTFAGQVHSSCVWIAYLAELDSAAQVAAYQSYLVDYARDQQRAGRFNWPPNIRLRNLMGWLDYHHVVPGDTRLSFLVALGLLIVCVANSASVLLSKFLRRDYEVGIRRTLGAPQSAIYMPCLIEAGLVGLAGGVLGVILSWFGLRALDWVLPSDIASLAHLDVSLLLLALAMAVLGTLLAALYPTWRVARTGLAGWSTTTRASTRLNLPPAFSVLRRHKMSVSLIILQIILSLAIVTNALFIIGQRIGSVREASGLDERNLFLVKQQWLGLTDIDSPAIQSRLDSLLQDDLSTLRNLPDVAAATPINALPLTGDSSNIYLNLKPLQQHGEAFAGLYLVDETTLTALGLHLVAGRDFSAADVRSDRASQPAIIVTRALAEQLFPAGSALGRTVYLNGDSAPSIVIGVVDRLSVSLVSGEEASSRSYAVMMPVHLSAIATLYAVRAKPGRMAAAMKAAGPALYVGNAMRLMDDSSVTSYADIRTRAYRADVGMAMLMGIVSLLLLVITGAGIAGLSSTWVSERRQQIGIRRALGARQRDILHHFQLENFAIAGVGTILGVGVAFGLNILLMHYFEMDTLPIVYVLGGAAMVLAIGQCAVFVPARQASRVPPAVAARSVR